MRTVRIAPLARRDIAGILAWSGERFGARVRARYRRLIHGAIHDLAVAPERPGSRARPELGDEIRTYHLASSRERARDEGGIIRRPRHLLVYRVLGTTHIEIVRVLHDAMDLERHLPEEDEP